LDHEDTLQVGIILVWKRHVAGILHLLVVLLEEGLVDLDSWWGQSWCSDELLLIVSCYSHLTIERISTYQGWVANQLSSQPQEWLLEVVVRLGGDVVVLEVLLAVEGDGLGLDLSLLHIDLVTAKDDRNVLADTDQVTYNVLVILWTLWGSINLRCQFGTFL
jgi:hypothetical protein